MGRNTRKIMCSIISILMVISGNTALADENQSSGNNTATESSSTASNSDGSSSETTGESSNNADNSHNAPENSNDTDTTPSNDKSATENEQSPADETSDNETPTDEGLINENQENQWEENQSEGNQHNESTTQEKHNNTNSPNGDNETEDAADQILSVSLPCQLPFTIDALELNERGQIYSDEYSIDNRGKNNTILTLTDVSLSFAEEENIIPIDVPFGDEFISDNKYIYMQIDFGREDMSPIVVTDSVSYNPISIPLSGIEEYDDMSSISLSVSGCVNYNYNNVWKPADVSLSISYTLDIATPEEEFIDGEDQEWYWDDSYENNIYPEWNEPIEGEEYYQGEKSTENEGSPGDGEASEKNESDNDNPSEGNSSNDASGNGNDKESSNETSSESSNESSSPSSGGSSSESSSGSSSSSSNGGGSSSSGGGGSSSSDGGGSGSSGGGGSESSGGGNSSGDSSD